MRTDADLIAALRAGDEETFAELVRAWGPGLLRLARAHVPSDAIAQEVLQEGWIGVLNGIDRFEGRSSLKTWVFRIVVNTAKTRGERERRTVPVSALVSEEAAGPALEDSLFEGGAWASPPRAFPEPAGQAEAGEELRVVLRAIAELPPVQRTVITMRDVEGFDAVDVCNALEVSETNQRVLLHRARTKVRQALERHHEAA